MASRSQLVPGSVKKVCSSFPEMKAKISHGSSTYPASGKSFVIRSKEYQSFLKQ
jgi:hypothetical protein